MRLFFGAGTAYQRAIIGWSGIVAEEKADPEQHFENLFYDCMDDPDVLSPSDRRFVEACTYRRPFTTFRKAMSIVENRWPEITRFAQQLSDNVGLWLPCGNSLP